MFFNLVRKSSQRNRKENGLFYISLIISIIAFYIVLSLESQDVMIFLKKMESDAVGKLLALIPVLYGVSLFILFFLSYFSGKYQMERRSHEFGMYLMMGMSRGRLFMMLAAEEIWSSLVSLIVGIPAAVFISEMVSLVTAKVIGLGIIGHQFSFSAGAIVWTIVGYGLVRAAVLLILSGQIVCKDIVELLSESQERKKKQRYPRSAVICLIVGILILAVAFFMSIGGYGWRQLRDMAVSVILGIVGIFVIFHGLSAVFDLLLKHQNGKKGLDIFNYRQLQEAVILQPNKLAVCCLLLIMAIGMAAYGIAGAFFQYDGSQHVLDYTFEGDGEEIQRVLNQPNVSSYFENVFQLKESLLHTEDGCEGTHTYSAEKLNHAIESLPDSEDKDILVNNFGYSEAPFIVSLSSYNEIRKAAGEEPLVLKENETAFYANTEFYSGSIRQRLQQVLDMNISIEMDGENYVVLPQLYGESLVADRAISMMYAWILPDDKFEVLSDGETGSYWNGVLKPELIREKGLMQAISEVNDVLDQTSLTYESYLKSIGRSLFYKVAASYTAVYLAVIFLLVSNTGIGVQFLMIQRKNGRRYRILLSLGCTVRDLCYSAGKQVTWYFMIPITVAVISSFFASWSLFEGASTASMRDGLTELLSMTGPVILALLVVEWVYMRIVRKMTNRSIEMMTEYHREDD